MAEDRAVELNIFDFDGTLFKSPTPNGAIWDRTSVGKLKAPAASMNFPGQRNDLGVGWFQDPITLSPPYVPETPDASWFISHVVDRVKKSAENEPLLAKDNGAVKCVTVLLTGRTTAHLDRVKQIVSSHGLKFDDFGLKPLGTKDSTMGFKQKFIKSLVDTHKPTHINIFEDRIEHFKKFDEFVKKTFPSIKSKIHLIDEPDGETALERELEMQLVNELLKKYTPGVVINRSVDYAAVVLTKESREQVLSLFKPPQDWRVYAHHMTITLGPLSQAISKGLPVEESLGTRVKLKVEALGQSEKAIAVKVSGFYSTNHIHHVTLAVSSLGKPVDSNFIREWTPVADTHAIEIEGTVEEVARLKLTIPEPPKKNKEFKFPVGGIIKKHHPEITGKSMVSAIQEVTEWMAEMKIDGSGQTHAEVETYIKEKKWKEAAGSEEPTKKAETDE